MKLTETFNPTILYLDCCKSSQDELTDLLINYCTSLTAYEKTKAIELVNNYEINVLVINIKPLQESDISFIQKIKSNYPKIICILIIDPNQDAERLSLIYRLNIFSIIKRPWVKYDFKVAVENAITFYNLRKEQQSLQQELQIAREKAIESDQLKSSFIANISHEIRTPLNSIIGFLSLFEDNEMDSEKLKKYKRIIEESTNKFLCFMEDMLIVSQLHLGKVKNSIYKFDLTKLFDEIYKHYSPFILYKKISFSTRGINEYDKLIIKADKAKLHTIFYHLLNNALKFTNSGYIEFGILSLHKNIFYVKDTGIGISNDKQKAIFQIFRQESDEVLKRDYGGCGLGLSIVKSMIEMLGGKIWLESEKNKGSTFFFKFPIELVVCTYKEKISST